MMFHWDEPGRSAGSSEGAPGADASIVNNSLIGLPPTVDGVGEVTGDKAGAENGDNKGSLTAVVVGGDGMIKGAVSQTKTTQSTISDPATRRIVPKRCVFITVPLLYSDLLHIGLEMIITRDSAADFH